MTIVMLDVIRPKASFDGVRRVIQRQQEILGSAASKYIWETEIGFILIPTFTLSSI